MSNKLTLLIDGNWLMVSRMSVMINMFDMTNDESFRESASVELQDRMARSINVIINRLPEIDNIVMVTDGGSWRKKLEVPTQLSTTYKGNRVHDEHIDWNRIYKALNHLSDRCRALGVTTCTYLNSEGDDWMWYWSRKLNSEGTNCIVWSSDKDLQQLVQADGGAFTGWYNDKNGLYLHKDLQEPELDVVDFFLTPCNESPLITQLKQHTTINYIDPNDIIIPKIICGDSSDNIKSIIRFQKNGRNFGVGDKACTKILNSVNISKVEDLIENFQTVAEAFCNDKKYKGESSVDKVVEMLEYNTKLVWLNEKVIPDTIIQAMNQVEYTVYDVNFIRNNYLVLTDQKTDAESIFDELDTPF